MPEKDVYTSSSPLSVAVDVTSARKEQLYISDELRDIFFFVNFALFCNIIYLLGTATNIVNIIVFKMMGFQDSINISLFALSISDLFSEITLLWIALCNSALLNVGLPIVNPHVSQVTGGTPHVIFLNITGWITGFVTLERFMCIAFPLKVKLIFTRRIVKFILVLIFLLVIASSLPLFYTHQLTWTFFPKMNRTLLARTLTHDAAEINRVVFLISKVIFPFGSLGLVLILTVALAAKLQQKAKWRLENTTSGDAKTAGQNLKDVKVANMMVVVSTLFIVCMAPGVVIFIVRLVVPSMNFNENLENVVVVCYTFANVLEGVNAAANCLVYYVMSSKYRSTLQQLLRRNRWEK